MNNYSVKVLADSFSLANGERLTSLEVTFPRFILAEVNTHRMLSRNSASSRAIPTEKLIERVEKYPFIPEFNERVKGMGVGEPLPPKLQLRYKHKWLAARDDAVRAAKGFLEIDKSRANRVLEPYMWHTAIISATSWKNFLALRTHRDAQPEFRTIALMIKEALHDHSPKGLAPNQWHLPFVSIDEFWDNPNWDFWKKVSVGRCARVSYLTHHGERDPEADIALHDRLLESGHMSPFEHVAQPRTNNLRSNFRGWLQYRKEIPYEYDYSMVV